jgi:hypothetical protein
LFSSFDVVCVLVWLYMGGWWRFDSLWPHRHRPAQQGDTIYARAEPRYKMPGFRESYTRMMHIAATNMHHLIDPRSPPSELLMIVMLLMSLGVV